MNYGIDFTAFMIALSMILRPIREQGKERRGDPGTRRKWDGKNETWRRGEKETGKGDGETREKTRRKETRIY